MRIAIKIIEKNWKTIVESFPSETFSDTKRFIPCLKNFAWLAKYCGRGARLPLSISRTRNKTISHATGRARYCRNVLKSAHASQCIIALSLRLYFIRWFDPRNLNFHQSLCAINNIHSRFRYKWNVRATCKLAIIISLIIIIISATYFVVNNLGLLLFHLHRCDVPSAFPFHRRRTADRENANGKIHIMSFPFDAENNKINVWRVRITSIYILTFFLFEACRCRVSFPQERWLLHCFLLGVAVAVAPFSAAAAATIQLIFFVSLLGDMSLFCVFAGTSSPMMRCYFDGKVFHLDMILCIIPSNFLALL